MARYLNTSQLGNILHLDKNAWRKKIPNLKKKRNNLLVINKNVFGHFLEKYWQLGQIFGHHARVTRCILGYHNIFLDKGGSNINNVRTTFWLKQA